VDDAAEADPSVALVARARSCPSAFFALCEEPLGRFRLEIGGPLPSGWCGHLFAQCASAGLSIERGGALRAAPGRWAGAFVIAPGDAETHVRGYDFLRMARRSTHRGSRPDHVRLARFAIRPCGEGEAACVEIEGEDRVGFLAWLIETFACFGLHPVRLRVETREGRVRDAFWLTGAAGTRASQAALAALGRSLERHCDAGAAGLRAARGGPARPEP